MEEQGRGVAEEASERNVGGGSAKRFAVEDVRCQESTPEKEIRCGGRQVSRVDPGDWLDRARADLTRCGSFGQRCAGEAQRLSVKSPVGGIHSYNFSIDNIYNIVYSLLACEYEL